MSGAAGPPQDIAGNGPAATPGQPLAGVRRPGGQSGTGKPSASLSGPSAASRLAAPVGGVAAVVVASLLREHGAVVQARVQLLETEGRLPPGSVAGLQDMWAAVDEAADVWLSRWASVNGRAESEGLSVSEHEWVSTKEAARMLGVSERRVRQLLDEGRLIEADRTGWGRRVARASVEARRAGAA